MDVDCRCSGRCFGCFGLVVAVAKRCSHHQPASLEAIEVVSFMQHTQTHNHGDAIKSNQVSTAFENVETHHHRVHAHCKRHDGRARSSADSAWLSFLRSYCWTLCRTVCRTLHYGLAQCVHKHKRRQQQQTHPRITMMHTRSTNGR